MLNRRSRFHLSQTLGDVFLSAITDRKSAFNFLYIISFPKIVKKNRETICNERELRVMANLYNYSNENKKKSTIKFNNEYLKSL